MMVDNGDGTFSIKSSYSFEKQKPVAWTDMKDCVMDSHKQGWAKDKLQHYTIPLYTAPRELSDEEIAEIYKEIFKWDVKASDRNWIGLARAILKKASEK